MSSPLFAVKQRLFASPHSSTELRTYARRLLSHDRLTDRELSTYISRRRQALWFFILQRSQVLRAWKDTHVEDARLGTDAAWSMVQSSSSSPQPERSLTLQSSANLLRVLGWWGANLNDERCAPRWQFSRDGSSLEVTQPKVLFTAQQAHDAPIVRRIRLARAPDALGSTPLGRAQNGELTCLTIGAGRILAAPCPEQGNYHLLSDMFLFERAAASDNWVVTDLDERKDLFIKNPMPFDLDLGPHPCACQRPFPVLKP